jgi:hypothetical protein
MMLEGAIVGYDPGTLCGWASWDGSRLESGVQDFSLKRGESPGMRWLRVNQWLDDLAGLLGPIALIAWEQSFQKSGYAKEIMDGFVTRFQEQAAKIGAATTSVHTNTLKKYATGSGRADKTAMMTAARDRGWSPQDDNECDALFVAQYVRDEIGA